MSPKELATLENFEDENISSNALEDLIKRTAYGGRE